MTVWGSSSYLAIAGRIPIHAVSPLLLVPALQGEADGETPLRRTPALVLPCCVTLNMSPCSVPHMHMHNEGSDQLISTDPSSSATPILQSYTSTLHVPRLFLIQPPNRGFRGSRKSCASPSFSCCVFGWVLAVSSVRTENSWSAGN